MFNTPLTLKYLASAAALTVFSILPATAADKDGSENWDGSLEFSAANASGNTESSYLGFGALATRKIGRISHHFSGGINYAETSDLETQNNFFAAYQLDFAINDRSYAYGRARYEEDAFSGFDDRIFLGAGYGYHLLKGDVYNWRLEGGPGYQLSHVTPPVPLTPGFEDEQSELALYANHDFSWMIRDGIFFEHDLSVTWTEPNTTVSNVFALTSKLTDALSSKVSYQTDYESDPPVGREDTDTLLKASVLYGF